MHTKTEEKMLLQVNHDWTLYIHTLSKDKQTSIYTIAKKFYGNWNTMHTRFQLVAKLLDFNTLKRDTTLIGYYYVRKGGDCLVCLPDRLKPENIYG